MLEKESVVVACSCGSSVIVEDSSFALPDIISMDGSSEGASLTSLGLQQHNKLFTTLWIPTSRRRKANVPSFIPNNIIS